MNREKCIECGKFLSKKEEVLCKRCIERQKENRKLQILFRKSVRVR